MISGDNLDPNVCTSLLRLAPTTSFAKGQQREGKRPAAPTGEWIIETDWMIVSCIDEGVDSLMQIVWPVHDAVNRLVSKSNVRVSVVSVIEIHGERPSFWLSQRSIDRMASLGAEYSMDLYDFQ